jgi:RNA polymerase sigma factor (TIGR02999 family)
VNKPGEINNFTQKLQAIEQSERKTSDELLPMVYEELRRLAAWKMSHEVPGHTLQATALVHEAWLRLAGQQGQQWQNRTHFFGAAAEAMRRILIESARRKKRLKHGGEYERVSLEHVELPSPMPDEELLALDEALDKLAEIDGRAAEVVKLCFFAGLTQPQAAKELGISLATVERSWAFARAWLFREIQNNRKTDSV